MTKRKQCIFAMLGILMMFAACARTQAMHPPKEKGPFREPDLVELVDFDPTMKLDIRYATANNFVGVPVYPSSRAFLQRPAAEALVKVSKSLRAKGYGLVIFDAYRPWRVTKKFWDVTPPEKKDFVADPRKGSIHNRGCAVDVSLYDLKTGETVTMPSAFDEFSERAHPDYSGGPAKPREMRDLLRREMEAEGFSVYEVEWWHYDHPDWNQYPILDIGLDEIK